MMYEIQSKSDFQVGATLIVRVPEDDIDHKAMNTILADRPEFILPFRHRLVDGQIEFTYQIGNRSKIAYLASNRSPAEYANLWVGILQPLLECNDWFMSPYSFVLTSEHLYCDRATNSIAFLYIPSLQPCSDDLALKNMITEIAKTNHVSDISFENKVVWAIQDFNIHSFLQMVKTYQTQDKKNTSAPSTPITAQSVAPVQEAVAPPQQPAEPKHTPIEVLAPSISTSAQAKKSSDDIAINFPANGKLPKKEKKPKAGLFGHKKEKVSKPKPESKNSEPWGKKKPSEEVIGGAAAVFSVTPPPTQVRVPQPVQPAQPADTPPMDMDDDVTQLDIHENGGGRTKFRYVGVSGHPRIIEISFDDGVIFTIGRFDASIGIKQSNFEFDKKTKAISRRHAAVEQNSEGYCIIDLDSGAGTFLNGEKLPPNAPFKLEHGSRISFGHSGADYVWEE